MDIIQLTDNVGTHETQCNFFCSRWRAFTARMWYATTVTIARIPSEFANVNSVWCEIIMELHKVQWGTMVRWRVVYARLKERRWISARSLSWQTWNGCLLVFVQQRITTGSLNTLLSFPLRFYWQYAAYHCKTQRHARTYAFFPFKIVSSVWLIHFTFKFHQQRPTWAIDGLCYELMSWVCFHRIFGGVIKAVQGRGVLSNTVSYVCTNSNPCLCKQLSQPSRRFRPEQVLIGWSPISSTDTVVFQGNSSSSVSRWQLVRPRSRSWYAIWAVDGFFSQDMEYMPGPKATTNGRTAKLDI